MSGSAHRDYSSTPLFKKLGIRERSRVVFLGAPSSLDLGPVPAGVEFLRSARGPIDVAVVFATRSAGLRRRLPSLVRALDPAGRLWIAWPKKASGVSTDLGFELVQGLGLGAGLVDNKSASVTETYQGLQFVYRLQDRPKA